RHRFQKRQCNGRSSQIEQAQHAWSVSAEAVITVEHMIERIVGRLYRASERICHAKVADEAGVVRDTLKSFAEIGGALVDA
ncbi:hypothetical protein, partial [Klebsiella pneumoniae]|uniref:hypothetical protein n=1 Tax=Klebsiella pneumoniae TaxID=573 RepID=UPI001E61CB9B